MTVYTEIVFEQMHVKKYNISKEVSIRVDFAV